MREDWTDDMTSILLNTFGRKNSLIVRFLVSNIFTLFIPDDYKWIKIYSSNRVYTFYFFGLIYEDGEGYNNGPFFDSIYDEFLSRKIPATWYSLSNT